MSAQTDGVNWLSLASVPQVTHTVVGWVRVDTDVGTVGLTGITNQFAGQVQGRIRQATDDSALIEHLTTDLTSSTVVLTIGAWRGFAWTYQGESNPGVSADGSLSGWLLEEGNASVGFDETLTPSSGESDASPDGIAIGSVDTNAGSAQATFAMVKIFEGTLTTTQMLTELQYRNPQQTAWASYAFRTGALETDDSGNARTLTNNTGGGSAVAFVSAEPTDILGDDPAASPTGPVAQVITTGV